MVREPTKVSWFGYPFETNAASFIQSGDLTGLRKPCFSYSYLRGG